MSDDAEFRGEEAEEPSAVSVSRSNRRDRLVAFGVALFVACVGAGLAAYYSADAGYHNDFDVFYAGAKFFRDGKNPYELIGPGREFQWWTPLYYPAPALVLLWPLTWLTLHSARIAFVGLSSFAFGYGIGRSKRTWLLIALLSQSFVSCATIGQWSILLLAGYLIPALRGVAVTKPNVGVALFAATRHRRDAVITCAVGASLLVLALVMRPSWISEWLDATRHLPVQRSAVFVPGGALVLIALLRWRRPEARYLVCVALLPQSPGLYSDLLLFAVPDTPLEVAILATLSYVARPLSYLAVPPADTRSQLTAYATWSTLVLMLPCALMILRRPNTSDLLRADASRKDRADSRDRL